MSVLHFKPELWSKILLGALEKALVFAGPMVVNRDYEGEISGPGDTVHITSLADPTISNYTPNSTLTYQTIVDAGQTLQIDQAKSWSVSVDDVDRRQAAGDMQSWMEERAAYRIADVADQFLAGQYTGVAAANVVGSTGSPIAPAIFSPTNPADFYIKVVLPMKVLLGQQNVPDDGHRYMIVPPWARGLVEQTGAFVNFPAAGGTAGDVMQHGFFGSVGGFNFMESNNSVITTPYTGPGTQVNAIQCGHRMAVTYAEQIVQTEALRAQATFADLVRGLHVYGAKLVRPEAITVAYALRPAGI